MDQNDQEDFFSLIKIFPGHQVKFQNFFERLRKIKQLEKYEKLLRTNGKI